MDHASRLGRAKRRHRSTMRSSGRVASVFAVLSLVVIVVSLASIAVCGWILTTERIQLRLAANPLGERALSRIRAAAEVAHSYLADERALSLRGSDLVQSVLPGVGGLKPAVGGAPGTRTAADAAIDSAIDMAVDVSVDVVPVLLSVGEVMTSGVVASPLQAVSYQLPFSRASFVQGWKSQVSADVEVLTLDHLQPVSSAWLTRVGAEAPAGVRPEALPTVNSRYGQPLADLPMPTRPMISGTRPDRAASGPTVLGSTGVYGSNPVVAIYHTHSSEAYQASQGAAYLWGSTDGVVSIGKIIAESLWNDYGISVVHSQALHDVDTFRDAYSRSASTAEQLVRTYGDLTLVLDIHRDATGGDIGATTTISGSKAAQVLILVTTDKYGLPHPNWRRNLSAAQQLQAALEELYPGLSRGIRQRDDGRFNQHLHPGSLLLEIGDVNNTKEEAVNCARLVAHAIAFALASGD
jgi:stage II sporulation protein P